MIRSRQENFFLILMMGALCTVSPFSIDMYLPGFPEIAEDLHTTVAKVSLSVSTYFVGFALGQLLYGPLLDRFGRKKPIYAGLSLYILTTVGCMAVKDVESLLVLRFFQALGGCVASVACMAMVRDFFPPKDGAKIYSLLILILGVSPLLAPTIGGFVVTHWGWRTVFGCLAVIVATLLAVIFFFMPVGYQPDRNVQLRVGPIVRTYWDIFKNPRFYLYSLSGSLTFAGLFVYVSGSPAIFMDGFKVSAQFYGGIFALLSVGFIGGSQLNLLLMKKFTNRNLFQTAGILQMIAAYTFAVGSYQGWLGLEGTMACLFMMMLSVGISNPNASALIMSSVTHNVGSASALMGFMQLGIGSLASAGVGMMDMKGSFPAAVVMATTSTLGCVILLLSRRSSNLS